MLTTTVVFLVPIGIKIAQAAHIIRTNIIMPIEDIQPVYIDPKVGEIVLSGNMHYVFNVSFDDGTYHVKEQYNPMGVTGIATGAPYKGCRFHGACVQTT